MNKEKTNNGGLDDLLKKALPDDLPADVESRMKKRLAAFGRECEDFEAKRGRKTAREGRGVFRAWPVWAFRKEALAFSSVAMIIAGAMMYQGGRGNALAESISTLNALSQAPPASEQVPAPEGGSNMPNGLIFVILGGAALALVSFSLPEIGAAVKDAAGVRGSSAKIRTSRFFWEASARNFWMLGALVSVMSFVNTLNSISVTSGGIAAVARGMASSLVPSVYGLVLAAACLLPAWKLGEKLLRQTSEAARPPEAVSDRRMGTFWRLETVVGYVLFFVLAAWTALKPFLAAPSLPFKPWAWFFYWPAVLIILGGTMAFALFVGLTTVGAPLVPSFALTALIGSLIGFIQVLLGFASKDPGNVAIGKIAAAMTFIISSCFLGLAGMILVGAPLEDRQVKAGRIEKPPALSRAAWSVFPLIAIIFLVLTFFLVITPVRK